ncbi:MAG: hypothetical protein JWL90_910 [Chthoniobacteraceae bacterium]|nr:hypothetical protein [Chthoniobacteraceae bacterium]
MLYFMKDHGHLKIGVTRDPKARLGAVQTGNPGKCCYLFLMELENDAEIERMLHGRLAHCVSSAGNEWFDVPYATALEHLFTLRPFWKLPGGQELGLASPPGPPVPRLVDHEADFVAWLRNVWFREQEAPHGITVEELWLMHQESYFKGEQSISEAEMSTRFKKTLAFLDSLP